VPEFVFREHILQCAAGSVAASLGSTICLQCAIGMFQVQSHMFFSVTSSRLLSALPSAPNALQEHMLPSLDRAPTASALLASTMQPMRLVDVRAAIPVWALLVSKTAFHGFQASSAAWVKKKAQARALIASLVPFSVCPVSICPQDGLPARRDSLLVTSVRRDTHQPDSAQSFAIPAIQAK